MITNSPVLISWVARDHDPYHKDRDGKFIENRDGRLVLGPTLSFLFDDKSPYKGRVQNMVLFHTEGDPTDELQAAIYERNPAVKIEFTSWKTRDPTDHSAIFEFLRTRIPSIREKYQGRELLIHVSPGTPSMQTIWVLMGTTGYIETPFQLVKSLRPNQRRGRDAVVPVELDIETFYKMYKAAEPRQVASEEQEVVWDPNNFHTDAMKNLFAEARRFAQIKVPVLLLGERGTGKTTLASWIRSSSPFRKKDLDQGWPAVACGQYTPELLRSELFGYVKGAFTGASEKGKEGLLAMADGDTLFLDEIGDLSSEDQRRLIKALEEKTYYKIGDTEPMKSDFRLLAATNRDMDELKKRLDLDFLDRINYLTLRLPPLREIADELDWLWPSAYRAAIPRSGVSGRQAQFAQQHHDHIVDRLKGHPLPGNMRDLFRVAYRILAARSDAYDPLSPKDAVDYGLEALSGFALSSSEADISRSVARAFADAEPFDTIVKQVGPLDTKAVERDLKQYMANEIRRIAKDTGQKVKELCDKDDRTLRNWLDLKG